MAYVATEALLNAKVTKGSDHYIEFDNGFRIEVENIECHINILGYKEGTD